MPTVSEILSDAHRLIEEGQHAKARSLLEPLLQTNSEDPDVWWIYAHAVEDEARGRAALERVAALSPDYPGIGTFLGDTSEAPATPRDKSLKRLPQRQLASETLATSDDMTVVDTAGRSSIATEQNSVDAVGSQLPAYEQTRPSWLYFVAASLVVVIVVLLLLSTGTNEQPAVADEQATETAVAIVSGQSAVTPTQQDTLPDTTPEMQVSDAGDGIDQSAQIAALREAFTSLEFAEEILLESATSLGPTTVIQVCAIPGPNAGATIERILSWSASNLSMDDDISAVGVRLIDCDSSQDLRTVAVPIDLVRALGAGEVSIRELETALQPVE